MLSITTARLALVTLGFKLIAEPRVIQVFFVILVISKNGYYLVGCIRQGLALVCSGCVDVHVTPEGITLR